MGKQTAFDTDIQRAAHRGRARRAGRGKVMSQFVENVDLYPTFVQLTGPRSGRRRRGPQPRAVARGQPRYAVAHGHARGTRGRRRPTDPDYEGGGGNPTTYEAIRI